MKIAITADVHLRSDKQERFENLNNILEIIQKKKIKTIIIAGDLFDAGYTGYKEFDNIAKNFSDIDIYIIPGNHDQSIVKDMFVEDNIIVISEPEIINIDNKDFLFLPYKNRTTMNREIEGIKDFDKLPPNGWYLISHGDFGGTNLCDNGNEKEYFPLTKKDLNIYMPLKVIFGHIHKPTNIDNKVYYPGSPYPLDINEQGQRRILILNTETGEIQNEFLNNTPVNLNKDIFIYPDESETEQLDSQIDELLVKVQKEYKGEEILKKLNLRINLNGFSSSIDILEKDLKQILKNRKIDNYEIRTDYIEYAEDISLSVISKMIKDNINKIKLEDDSNIKNLIFKKAMEIIYRR